MPCFPFTAFIVVIMWGYCLHLLQRKLHQYFSLTHNTNTSLTGAKSITKAMKKVASGPQRDQGIKWFSELLSDKGLSITVIFTLFLSNGMFNFIIYWNFILVRVLFLLIYHWDHYFIYHQSKAQGHTCTFAWKTVQQARMTFVKTCWQL